MEDDFTHIDEIFAQIDKNFEDFDEFFYKLKEKLNYESQYLAQ